MMRATKVEFLGCHFFCGKGRMETVPGPVFVWMAWQHIIVFISHAGKAGRGLSFVYHMHNCKNFFELLLLSLRVDLSHGTTYEHLNLLVEAVGP